VKPLATTISYYCIFKHFQDAGLLSKTIDRVRKMQHAVVSSCVALYLEILTVRSTEARSRPLIDAETVALTILVIACFLLWLFRPTMRFCGVQ
jgi:hypothetical protein